MKTLKILPLLIIFVISAVLVGGCGEGEADYDRLIFSTNAEWLERDDGLEAFEDHYGVEWPRDDVQSVELGLTYEAVGEGEADVGIGDATEGRIELFDLHILEDDEEFFPAYNPAPVIRQEIVDAYPELEDEFRELSSSLDQDTLGTLNKEVTVEDRQPEDVAMEYLLEEGFIEDEDPEVDPDREDPPIVVGGKTFPEALTLGAMTVYYLEGLGYEVVDETGLGEVAVIRPALETGEVDVYWEYTGTGLFNVMEHDEVIADAEECWQTIRDWDLENNDLLWLDYAPANNTYVFFTNQQVYEEYGFETISELMEYIEEQQEQIDS